MICDKAKILSCTTGKILDNRNVHLQITQAGNCIYGGNERKTGSVMSNIRIPGA